MIEATFGAEYELGDVDRLIQLPSGAHWNFKDHSIANSTGIANDEKAKLYTLGGEINSDPTDTIEEQLAIWKGIVKSQERIHINHRTNLHLHIHVPGLRDDLGLLKKLMVYVQQNQDDVYRLVEPLTKPQASEFGTEASYQGALQRYKRRSVSHQNKLKPKQVEACLSAETPEEFINGHAPKGKDGTPQWALAVRGGINISQLRETNTIEFRHFTPCLDTEQLQSCFEWIHSFVNAALVTGESVQSLYAARNWKFPPFAPYNHDIDVIFRWTDLEKNKRSTVKERLARMSEHFDIYIQSAAEMSQFVSQESDGKLVL
jgi:hypothetical protein